ncbi:MAG: homoserine kinase [Pseudomonadota bacterium]
MAVYTKIGDQELRLYLEQYDIGEAHALKGIAEGVENSNFILSTDAGMYILTLYEKRVKLEDLPFFLGLMEHLAKQNFPCPQPIELKNGETLSTLANRPSAIISFLDGNSVNLPEISHCEQVGEALAQMHLAGEGFTISRPNGLTVGDWRPLYEWSKDRANSVATGLSDMIEEELTLLENAWPNDLPAGIIHADLFPDNVFFLKDEFSGMIDYYFACNDLLAYDLAICINAWCFEPDFSFNADKTRALVEGYERARKLSNQELEYLPLLCRGSALRFLLTRLYDWLNVPEGALVVPKDPLEYIEKLRFHQSITSVSGYGIKL